MNQNDLLHIFGIMHFNYSTDTVNIDGKKYNLEDIRQHLFDTDPAIIFSHRVKKIWIGGEYKWTYDWDTIYFKSKQLIQQYAKQNNNKP